MDVQKISFSGVVGRLESLSYENVLKRGFAMVEDENFKLVKSVKELKIDSDINIKFKDGKVKAKVKKKI